LKYLVEMGPVPNFPPEYPVEPTIEDVLSGKDTEIEFVMGLIKKEKEK